MRHPAGGASTPSPHGTQALMRASVVPPRPTIQTFRSLFGPRSSMLVAVLEGAALARRSGAAPRSRLRRRRRARGLFAAPTKRRPPRARMRERGPFECANRCLPSLHHSDIPSLPGRCLCAVPPLAQSRPMKQIVRQVHSAIPRATPRASSNQPPATSNEYPVSSIAFLPPSNSLCIAARSPGTLPPSCLRSDTRG